MNVTPKLANFQLFSRSKIRLVPFASNHIIKQIFASAAHIFVRFRLLSIDENDLKCLHKTTIFFYLDTFPYNSTSEKFTNILKNLTDVEYKSDEF